MKRIPARTILKGVKCTSRPGDPHTRSGGRKPEETKVGYLHIWAAMSAACSPEADAETIHAARVAMRRLWE